ncbi:hypothetical protein DM02DRAFT_658298 [Periconia macrospinosa]|uniref:Uncharacterized protein n=1 Tax=Periconia macrospinosa TaxID=97972 RepID=A0A2V1DHV5_9PLEO|nr:hypothetical protein DM02DRAFT_658298 [Periconia macrospinosa]
MSSLRDKFMYAVSVLDRKGSRSGLVMIRRVRPSSGSTKSWISQAGNDTGNNYKRLTLFAYPAQSNMNGRRLPLCWASLDRKAGAHANTYILLDVAALITTTSLDLRTLPSRQTSRTCLATRFTAFRILGLLSCTGLRPTSSTTLKAAPQIHHQR